MFDPNDDDNLDLLAGIIAVEQGSEANNSELYIAGIVQAGRELAIRLAKEVGSSATMSIIDVASMHLETALDIAASRGIHEGEFELEARATVYEIVGECIEKAISKSESKAVEMPTGTFVAPGGDA